MSKNLSRNIVNLVLALVGIGLFISAQGIKTGAAMAQGSDFMPKLLTGIWVVLSIAIFLSGLRENKEDPKNAVSIRGFIATLVLLFAYIALLQPIGFTVASILYVFIQTLLFAPKEYKTMKNYIIFAIIAIILPIAINLLFTNVFSLILPEGTIFTIFK